MSQEVILALVKIGFGALAGGLTNTVAVWMLFHPYEPPTLFGRLRISFLHGAVPKNQARLASAIGRTVGSRLLTPEDLTDTFANVEFRQAFDQRLAIFLEEVLYTDRGSLNELIPGAVANDVDALIADALHRGMEQLHRYIASDDFENFMLSRTDTLVSAIADQPVAGILTPVRGEAFESLVQDWIQNVADSDEFSRAVADYIDRVTEKTLAPSRNFEEILPLGLIGSLEKAIAGYLPLAAERLGGLLEDPETRKKFEGTIQELFQRLLRDLKFHQRVVARVMMTEDTVDKVLDTIQEDGAERLSEILRDPAVQEAIARVVNQAIVDFLRRPVGDVLGNVDEPNMVEARDTLTGWVVGLARDRATREFILEQLHEGMDKAGAKTWGDVLTRMPNEKISALLVGAARTDITHRAVETGARRLASEVMSRPIGIPARWFTEDGLKRIENALGDPIWNWLQTQVPAVVERIDVARRVEDKVLNFPTARMEELVHKVTDRELRLIVRLGYVLGAFIGLLMVAADAVLR